MKYVYNKEQALWFIDNGGELKDVDIHKKTGRIFFVFKDNDFLQSLYNVWNNRKRR